MTRPDRDPVARRDGDPMAGPHGDPVVDPLVRQALQRRPVPDHAPDFWRRLDRRLVRYDAEVTDAASTARRAESDEAGVGVITPARRNGTGPWARHRLPRGAGPSGDATEPGGRHRLPRRRGPSGEAARPRGHHRLPRGAGLVAAAAAIVALVAVALALLMAGNGGEVEVGPADVPGDGGPTSTAPAPTSSPPSSPPGSRPPTTSTPAPPSDTPPGSEEAVLAFLDALGSGDVAGAASRIGPQSEGRITETTGRPVEEFLQVAEEGYGAWAAVDDRTVETIELGQGRVVVVVSGSLSVEGTVEERADAFPARYAESASAWLVEPWAYDVSADDRPTVVTPALAGGDVRSLDGIDEVEAEMPGEGTAWLSIDGGSPLEGAVGAGGRATWQLADELSPGYHTLTVAFENDITFAASAAVGINP